VELTIYIKELLYKNDNLIIPGVGGFFTSYRAAEIIVEEHSISPPAKFLVFDKELDRPDDVLVQYLIRQKKITKKAAEKFIKQQVDSLNKKLNKGETILLEGIGYLSKNNEVIRFDRDHDSNFLTGSYGLSKIDYKPLDVTIIPHQISIENYPKRPVNYVAIIVITILILTIGGGIVVYIFFPDKINRYFPKPLKKIEVVTKSVPKPVVNPSVQKTNKTDTSKVSDLEKFYNNKTDKKNALALDTVKPVKPSTGKSYFIIAGSFKTFQRATIQAKKFQKLGLKTEVLQFSEDIYRVSLGEFGVREEAMQKYDTLRNMKGIESVWVLAK